MRSIPLLAAAFVAAAAAAAPAHYAGPERHFDLRSSVPADEAVVDSLGEVRLTFTEVPQANSTAARLLDGGGEPVETGELRQDPEDGRVFTLPVPQPVAAGPYTVSWRGIGSDGHVVRGDFSFTVTRP